MVAGWGAGETELDPWGSQEESPGPQPGLQGWSPGTRLTQGPAQLHQHCLVRGVPPLRLGHPQPEPRRKGPGQDPAPLGKKGVSSREGHHWSPGPHGKKDLK